jgi:TolB-like protein
MVRMAIVLAFLGFAAVAVSAEPPATQPARMRVFIGPIASVNREAMSDTGCRGLRANLIHALGRADLDVVAGESAGDPADYGSVARQGAEAGARFAICASCQSAGVEVRFLAAVVDCNSGRVVDSFRATGKSDELIDLEDCVVDEVMRGLPHGGEGGKAVVAMAQANSGPLVDHLRAAPSPWDRRYTDTDAEDSMNNLRYGNLDSLSGYGFFGYGGYGCGYGFFPSTNYNFVGYGPVWGTAYPVWGQNSQP